MRVQGWMGIGATTAAMALAVSTNAGTFRDTTVVNAVFQVPNPIATNTDVLAFDTFGGHDLVNLALGANLTTVQTNRVLALEISCDSTTAKLVVFDVAL